MATVVVTFFLIARFYVCKMDADFKEKQSAKISTLNGKRWSMNSQRLEEIVAELMRPIGDLRHSFDTDLSALLEEYLTEAGLHALDAEDSDDEGESAGAVAAPNFAELALLLQQSASIYGRKVDCLYQHVLSVSESLQHSTIEITNTSNDNDHPEEPQTPSTSRRKRKASTLEGFGPIELERCAGARREPGAARPPPTLPRMYIELEPRVMGEGDAPLYDYAGEPIGLLADFHVAWRLQNGLLVEELDGYSERAALRPIPLMELQAAIEANAPPSPPPLPREDSPPPDPAPLGASTPLLPDPPPRVASADMPPPPARKERKRRAEGSLEDMAGVKLLISKELRKSLSRVSEFDGAAEWVERVVRDRSRILLLARRRLRAATRQDLQFRGFEYCSQDTSGFIGWNSSEVETAAELMRSTARLSTRLPEDSDDDGFFEQSSLGDSDASRGDDYSHSPTAEERERLERSSAEAAEWAAWRARVAARAQRGEQRAPLDVQELARAVIAHLPEDGEPKHFDSVLREAATDESDVSRLFLATLFLANSGNVAVLPGAPLALNSFGLQLVSADERLYSAAAAEDPVSLAAPGALAPQPPPSRTPHTTPQTSQARRRNS